MSKDDKDIQPTNIATTEARRQKVIEDAKKRGSQHTSRASEGMGSSLDTTQETWVDNPIKRSDGLSEKKEALKGQIKSRITSSFSNSNIEPLGLQEELKPGIKQEALSEACKEIEQTLKVDKKNLKWWQKIFPSAKRKEIEAKAVKLREVSATVAKELGIGDTYKIIGGQQQSSSAQVNNPRVAIDPKEIETAKEIAQNAGISAGSTTNDLQFRQGRVNHMKKGPEKGK